MEGAQRPERRKYQRPRVVAARLTDVVRGSGQINFDAFTGTPRDPGGQGIRPGGPNPPQKG